MSAVIHPTRRTLAQRLWIAAQIAWCRYRLRCNLDSVRHYRGMPVVGADYLINCENQRQALRSRIRQLEQQ